MAETFSVRDALTIGEGTVRFHTDRGKLGNRSVRDIAILAKLLVMRIAVMPRPNKPIANRNATMRASLLKLNFV
jgi:hypothetical protein